VPHGAGVIRHQGRRAAVWRIKYRDATGRAVMETLGREPQWTRRKAERELGKRLAAVEEGWRKPDKLTFATFSKRFQDEYLPGRNLKATTLENYRYMLERHLLPHFGRLLLTELESCPELIDGYISLKARTGLSPKTINNHLLLLNLMLRRATVWRLIRTNLVASIDRPHLPQPEMNVLTEVEIARLGSAYDELHREAAENERPWWLLAKAIRRNRARHWSSPRRATRSALGRGRPARRKDHRARGARSGQDKHAQEQSIPPVGAENSVRCLSPELGTWVLPG
jgi:hypothetical protein